MCIAAWIWQDHPLYPLILLHNRDEFHNRPTQPVGWWDSGGRAILGGKDLQAGGTWLGCTEGGKLAFLTNVREPQSVHSAKSRGDLPIRFLQSLKDPLTFAKDFVEEADQYNGFNLVLGDLSSKIMVYISNRPKGEPASVQVVSPGLHVLSNARLNTSWPKARLLRRKLKEAVGNYGGDGIPPRKMVEELMGDTAKASRDELPSTGCDPDWESKLSSIFVDTTDAKLARYGTRSQIALFAKLDGEVSLYERYLEEGTWKEHSIEYRIESNSH